MSKAKSKTLNIFLFKVPREILLLHVIAVKVIQILTNFIYASNTKSRSTDEIRLNELFTHTKSTVVNGGLKTKVQVMNLKE